MAHVSEKLIFEASGPGQFGIGVSKFLIGLFLLGTGPVFMATAFRTIRRKPVKTSADAWERATDYFVAPVFAAWSAMQIVHVLPALVGLNLELPEEAGPTIAIAAAVAMIIRIFMEGLVARLFPLRLAQNLPEKLAAVSTNQKLVSVALRAVLFAFVGSGFIGFNWYLLLGDIFFVTPTLLGIWQSKFPNSTVLFQVLPAGLPNLAFGKYLNTLTLGALTLAVGASPDLATLAFVILPVPGMLLSIARLFARSPKPGDVRWYLRPSLQWLYRVGGLAMFLYVLKVVGFAPY